MRFSMKALAISIGLAFAVVAPGAALAGHKHHGHKKHYGHHQKHFKHGRGHGKHFGHGRRHYGHGKHHYRRHKQGYGHTKHYYRKRHYGYGHRRHHRHGYGHRYYRPGVTIKLFHGSRYQAPERYEERESYETKAAPAEIPTETIVWNTDRVKEWPETCLMTREYQTEIVVGGESVQGYGQACLQPDGSWYRGPAQPVPY